MMTPNQQAFLDMIAMSELGAALLAESDDGYDILVGSTPSHPLLFHSYADHPRIHNEKLNSDAAGRYQILGRYYDAYKKQLQLPDFGHESQDKIALKMISECHALDDIEGGRLQVAIAKCSSRWASFPGNNYQQHQQKISYLTEAFTKAGGHVSA